MDKVLLGKIFMLISFTDKVFTHKNSQQMWMNFNTFSSFSRADCAIQINLSLDAVYCCRVNFSNDQMILFSK